jgi:chromosome segregation ATPase
MADLVNASPTDIRKLAGALGAYRKEVEAASRRVQGALNAANWHDPQKDKFEAHYRDLQRGINSFLNGEVDQMIKDLSTLAQKLAEIQSMRP